MKTVEVWQWNTLWIGKMGPTRYKCTEESIRASNPEAVRIPGTMELRRVYESGDDVPEAHPPFPWRRADSPYAPSTEAKPRPAPNAAPGTLAPPSGGSTAAKPSAGK